MRRFLRRAEWLRRHALRLIFCFTLPPRLFATLAGVIYVDARCGCRFRATACRLPAMMLERRCRAAAVAVAAILR